MLALGRKGIDMGRWSDISRFETSIFGIRQFHLGLPFEFFLGCYTIMQVIPFHAYVLFGAYGLLTILEIGLMVSSPLNNSKLVVYTLYT